MIKKLLVVLALVLTCAIARAQTSNKIAISVSGDGGISTDNSIGGPGFTVKAELPLVNRLNFTISAAFFLNYYGTRYYDAAEPPVCSTCIVPVHPPTGPVNDGPYEFIPIKAGLRYYYFRHLYFEGEAGEAIAANATTSTFVYGGNLGGLVRVSRHSSTDIGIGYSYGYKQQDYNEKVGELYFKIGYRFQF